MEPAAAAQLPQRRSNGDMARCGDAARAGASAITVDATAGVEYKISVAGAFAGAAGGFKGTIHRGPNTNLYTTADTQAGDAQGEVAAAALAVGAGGASPALQCSLDGAAYAPCAAGQRYGGLAEGPHTLRVKAAAGGFEDPSPAVSVFTVDTTAPDMQFTSFQQPPPGTGAEMRFGSTEGGGQFECSLDGSLPARCNPSKTIDDLCPGAHTFSVRSRDRAFNFDPTPALRQFTTPAGAPECGSPSVATDPAQDPTPFNAIAYGDVDANGSIVAAYFEYGTTTAYGARTPPELFAGDTPGGTIGHPIYGRPNEVLHFRIVARTSTGLVFVGSDRIVTLDAASASAPTLQVGTPTVTPTTIELPYTAKYNGPDDAVVGALLRAGDAAEPRWGDLRRLPGDGSGRHRLEPPLVIHTAALPPGDSAQPQQPQQPAAPGAPQTPPAAKSAIERLRFGAGKLRKLRKGKWKARVLCNHGCRVRCRLERGKTVIARATAARRSAGTASAKPKLTKQGRSRLRGAGGSRRR